MFIHLQYFTFMEIFLHFGYQFPLMMAKGVITVCWNSLSVIKLQNDICLFIEANEIHPDLKKYSPRVTIICVGILFKSICLPPFICDMLAIHFIQNGGKMMLIDIFSFN